MNGPQSQSYNDLDFTDLQPSDWINDLQPFEAERAREMFAFYRSYEHVATLWLSGPRDSGFDNTGSPDFFRRVKDEFSKLICGDPDYAHIRAEAKKHWKDKKVYVVTPIAAFIGAQVGVGAAVLVPVIALLLAGVTQIGINAWCGHETDHANKRG